MGGEGRDRRWERENKKMITKQNEPKRNRTQKKRVSIKGEMGGWAGLGGLAKNCCTSFGKVTARCTVGLQCEIRVVVKALATGLHYVPETYCVLSDTYCVS